MTKENTTKINWTKLATVLSESNSDRSYSIDKRDDSGSVRCSCMSFRFKKFPLGHPSKTCKHIETLRTELMIA